MSGELLYLVASVLDTRCDAIASRPLRARGSVLADHGAGACRRPLQQNDKKIVVVYSSGASIGKYIMSHRAKVEGIVQPAVSRRPASEEVREPWNSGLRRRSKSILRLHLSLHLPDFPREPSIAHSNYMNILAESCLFVQVANGDQRWQVNPPTFQPGTHSREMIRTVDGPRSQFFI